MPFSMEIDQSPFQQRGDYHPGSGLLDLPSGELAPANLDDCRYPDSGGRDLRHHRILQSQPQRLLCLGPGESALRLRLDRVGG